MARILFIDDDDGFRNALTRHLIRKGHTVTSIGDYNKVREKLDVRQFDIVLLDFCFPDTSGSEIFSLLHLVQGENDFEIVNPPNVVLITGHPKEFIEDKLLVLKATRCLVKPVTKEEIDRVISELTENRARESSIFESRSYHEDEKTSQQGSKRSDNGLRSFSKP